MPEPSLLTLGFEYVEQLYISNQTLRLTWPRGAAGEMWLKPNLKHPASKMMLQEIFSFPDFHPRWIPWILNGAFEFSRWHCWEQSRNMADWLYTVSVGGIHIHASHNRKLFIFILGICSFLQDRLSSKRREQRPFHFVLFSACVHTCPDATSDIGKIIKTSDIGKIIKET